MSSINLVHLKTVMYERDCSSLEIFLVDLLNTLDGKVKDLRVVRLLKIVVVVVGENCFLYQKIVFYQVGLYYIQFVFAYLCLEEI